MSNGIIPLLSNLPGGFVAPTNTLDITDFE